jgi:trigger factor
MTSLATPQNEFSNNEVRVIVHRKPHCLVELEVHTSAPMIQRARQMAIKSVNKTVSFPGFRKGKAPEEMIVKKFGAQVEKDLHQQLADLAYVEAQKLAHIPRLNNNAVISFQMKKILENEAELSFTFETEPMPPSVDPTQFIAVPTQRPQVTEKEIDEAIRQMQYFYAAWEPIIDRPIEDGDTIMINLDTLEENGHWNQVFNHVRFEVSKERMADWMKNLVKGAKTGDVLEGMSQPDETATEEEKNEFKPKKIRLTLLKAEKATLPTLDEEFAHKVGAPSVEAMRQSIAELLNAQADEKVLSEKREQINDFLINTYPFDLPASLIETEKKHRFNQAMENPKFKNQWNRLSQDEQKQIETNLEIESNQAVRLFFLSHSIVKEAKIPITHKQIEDEAVATLQSFGNKQVDKIPKEVYALALSKVVLTQAQNYILQASKTLT